MSDKMPASMDEEAVREWRESVLFDHAASLPLGAHSGRVVHTTALAALDRAWIALVEAKVREAIPLAKDGYYIAGFYDKGGFIGANRVMLPNDDAIVSRVMGDQPSNASGGHEAEGREAPRG